MKNKTKKLLAGLSIGLTLASGGLMVTGCTETPVTDAQVEKIFEALDNANKFMEDTKDMLAEQNDIINNLNSSDINEYDSEKVKNIVLDYIVEGLKLAREEKSIQINCNHLYQNDFNEVVTHTQSSEYKMYIDSANNKIKHYFKDNIITQYSETVLNNNVYNTTTYMDDGASKVYYTDSSNSYYGFEKPERSYAIFTNSKETLEYIINLILDTEYSGVDENSWIMTKQGEKTLFRVMLFNKLSNNSHQGYLEFEFDGYELSKLVIYQYTYVGLGEVFNESMQEYVFTRNIDNITFDTTGYIELENS